MSSQDKSKPELIKDSTEVPQMDGEMVVVRPGDVWPAPYRGSKYTIRLRKRQDGRHQHQLLWTRQEALYNRSLFRGLKPALVDVKGNNFGGSIRIGEKFCAKSMILLQTDGFHITLGN